MSYHPKLPLFDKVRVFTGVTFHLTFLSARITAFNLVYLSIKFFKNPVSYLRVSYLFLLLIIALLLLFKSWCYLPLVAFVKA